MAVPRVTLKNHHPRQAGHLATFGHLVCRTGIGAASSPQRLPATDERHFWWIFFGESS
ncbi:MAG: hypothetical protein AAGG51_01235 [Cyanobacteria bacterium P01_G01_bin.54]